MTDRDHAAFSVALTASLGAVVSPERRRLSLTAWTSAIRWRDVIILQGMPLAGMLMASRSETVDLGRVLAGTFASGLLVGHVFSLNDWAGFRSDGDDPNKRSHSPVALGLARDQVATLSLVLLAASLLIAAWLPQPTLLLCLTIAILGALYSHPICDAKGTPIVSSLTHVTGGAAHFLFGYLLFAPLASEPLLVSLFFGLTFAAGHLTQEARDRDSDRQSGLRTNAVAFGRTRMFVAALGLFIAADGYGIALAALGLIPTSLIWILALLGAIHTALWYGVARRGLSFESISRLRTCYQILYVTCGAGLAIAWLLSSR